MTPTNDIALKIKQLLELANRNDNENEAAVAMSRAQTLMAKYNLDMAQVGAATDSKAISESEDIKRVKETHKRGAMYEYQQKLWATVASVNYCWHWLVPVYKTVTMPRQDGYAGTTSQHRKVTNHHYLCGQEANVISAKIMGDYLEQVINRMCPYQGAQCLSRKAISWKEGMASRLQVRLRERFVELQDESVKAAADTKALTLVNVQDAEYNGNYAFMYGQAALEDMLRRRVEREAERRQQTAERIVNAPAEKPETNAARKKREAKEARESAAWQRKQDKYWERRDLNAWYEGRSKANDVSLDGQVTEGKGERSLE